MSKNKIIILIVLLVVILLGAYYFFNNKEEVREEAPVGNAKININAVCEGALAYMSFPDGASADKFVQDCKDGKHPEVIEKYKADMGLGDGAAI